MAKRKFVMDDTPYTRTEVATINGEEVAVNKTVTLLESFTQLMKSRRFNFQQLSLDSIIPNPKNEYYRSITPENEIQALASSIELQGLLHNLVVRTTDKPGEYMLIAGEKRFGALKLLHEKGIDDYTNLVPVNLIEEHLTDEQEELLIHASNIISRKYQQEVLIVAIDKFEKLLRKQAESSGEKVENINELISKLGEISVSKVKRYRSINKNLVPRLKKKFEDGQIGVRDAEAYIKLSDEEQNVAADALDQGVKLDFGQTKVIAETIIEQKEKQEERETSFEVSEKELKIDNKEIDAKGSESSELSEHDEKRNQIIEKVKTIREERKEKPSVNVQDLMEHNKKLFIHDLEKLSGGIKKSLEKYFQREEEYRAKYEEYSPEYSIIKNYMLEKFNGGDQ